MRTPAVRRLLPAVACALVAVPVVAAPNLFLEIRTDFVPGVDFTSADVDVCQFPSGPCYDTTPVGAFSSETAEYLEGKRIVELEVPSPRTYRIVAELITGTGRRVATRSVVLDLRGPRVQTILLVKPDIHATKKADLLEDRDGDGALSPGDILRYEISVDGATKFLDTPAGRLIVGSVTTTGGTVFRGNGAGHTTVEVRSLSRIAGAVITFDVEVEAAISNQGTAHFERWGQPTDDPETEAVDDPTIRPVTCALGSCQGSLENCQEERQELKDELTELLADPDHDGVPAISDDCPGTSPGSGVDAHGCSLAQFCAAIDISTTLGESRCRYADWLGDEPQSLEPADCLVPSKNVGGPCRPA